MRVIITARTLFYKISGGAAACGTYQPTHQPYPFKTKNSALNLGAAGGSGRVTFAPWLAVYAATRRIISEPLSISRQKKSSLIRRSRIPFKDLFPEAVNRFFNSIFNLKVGARHNAAAFFYTYKNPNFMRSTIVIDRSYEKRI